MIEYSPKEKKKGLMMNITSLWNKLSGKKKRDNERLEKIKRRRALWNIQP